MTAYKGEYKMKCYVITTATRNCLFLCEKDNDIFLGSGKIKKFMTRKEAKNFMKTTQFKNIHSPYGWEIISAEVKVKEVKL